MFCEAFEEEGKTSTNLIKTVKSEIPEDLVTTDGKDWPVIAREEESEGEVEEMKRKDDRLQIMSIEDNERKKTTSLTDIDSETNLTERTG